ncbi:MAG: carboxymuconolactone decarboxylase family protein, partial [Perlucidibaca sp.]
APAGVWKTPGRIRLAPLSPTEANLLQRLLSSLTVRIGRVNAANLFLMLLRNVRLFWAWLGFAKKLMPYGQLERRDTELAILRVAWNCRSRYEWGQHVDIGLRAGLSPQDIIRVAHGPKVNGWDERTRAILHACDEIHAERMVAEKTWHALAGHYDDKRLLELIMLISHYEMLAGVLISTGLELDSCLERVLAEAPIHDI